MWCWGFNNSGQVGDGSIVTERLNPVRVLQSPGGPPLSGVQAIALNGDYHSCALMNGSEARCWGSNGSGQLGIGTITNDERTPVTVLQSSGGPPLSGVQALALGSNGHTCALVSGGGVRCWGANHSGQLGDGTTIGRPSPGVVLQGPGGPPFSGALALALGASHSCVLIAGGEVRCWGDNSVGELGDGTYTQRPYPVAVLQSPGGPPLSGVKTLSLGFGFSCALLEGGEVRCWGLNQDGQVGDGTTTVRANPVAVLQSPGGPPLSGVQALEVGSDHSCAVVDGGEVRCWGYNGLGQLGDGTEIERHSPVAVLQGPGGPPFSGALALALGGRHSCALTTGGKAHCWGKNYLGQLGDGTGIDRHYPVPVVFLPSAVGVQAP